MTRLVTFGFRPGRRRALMAVLGGATALLAAQAPAVSEPINVDNSFNFRDFRTPNSAGLGSGDFITFGVLATPNNTDTVVTASQNGASFSVPFLGPTASPDEFVRSRPWSITPHGQWDFTLSNGTDIATAMSEGAGDAVRLPVVTNMALTPNATDPTMPTLTWTNPTPPTGGEINKLSISIFDLSNFLAQGSLGVGQQGVANRVFTTGIDPTATSFTVPTAANLKSDQLYTVAIQTEDLRSNSGTGAGPNILSLTRAFFDFNTAQQNLPGGTSGPVYLPIVNSSSGTPVYSFNVDVTANQPVLIDPEVAVGYDYAIGAGDPNFASVTLPDVGSGMYELYLFDTSDVAFDTGIGILADVTFDFTSNSRLDPFLGTDHSGGVSKFRILGIDAAAMLDPHDTQAFVSALTFVGGGTFTGTMTPITVNTPEPASLALFGFGLAGLGWVRRRRQAA